MRNLQHRLCTAAHEDDERPTMRLRGVVWALWLEFGLGVLFGVVLALYWCLS